MNKPEHMDARPRVKKTTNALAALGRRLVKRKKVPVFHAFNRVREAAPEEAVSVRSDHPAECFVLKMTGCAVAGFSICDGD